MHAPRIGIDRTVLFIRTPRLECQICQQVLNAVLPGVVKLCNYTKSFARIVVDLRKKMTIRDVARYLGVREAMVRGIDKVYLQKTSSKPRLRDLEVIAIDEIYVGKKNKFFTIVIDWQSCVIAKAKVRKHSSDSRKACARPEQRSRRRHGHVKRLLRSRHEAFAERNASVRSISHC